MNKTACGTESYMCPELLDEQEYNHKADIWSLGCIIFFMLFGQTPFKSPYVMRPLNIIKEVCRPQFSIDNALKQYPQVKKRNP